MPEKFHPSQIKVPVSDGFIKVPQRPSTSGTPGPTWPANTPCERPHVHPDSDEPYRAPRPAQPSTNK